MAELHLEITALPKHIAEIEKALVSHKRKVESDQAALAANRKENKNLEGEIQAIEQKASHLRDQMLGAKTNAQYRAFQNEISFCDSEIRDAEDRILDLMAASEPLEENLKLAEAALRQEQQHVEREKAVARQRSEADQQQLDELNKERQGIVSSLDPQVYSTYERARKKHHGMALAEGTNSRCSACNIVLRPQFFQDLKKADKLMLCESCGRLLYYNPPIEVIDEAESRQAEA